MHGRDRVAAVLDLGRQGRSATEIARLTTIPRSTIRDWLAGAIPRSRPRRALGTSCGRCGARDHRFADLPPTYVYLLGLYLGDGRISEHARSVYRLRIHLDLRYREIIAACEAAIREVAPLNRVSRRIRRSNYGKVRDNSSVEVSAYSKSWPCLFPQHGPGKKHHRSITLTGWQRSLVARDPEQLLRGLIHSDGCRSINTGTKWRYPRYSFSNLSQDIREIFCHACELVDVRYTHAPRTIYVSRKADVDRLDEFIGAKR